jgi:hypothetical protein
MFRLPLELHQAIFHHLNFKELVRAQTVSRQWQQIILDSSLWPSSVYVTSGTFDTWSVIWPDWTEKEKGKFQCNPKTTRQVLQSFSKGSTKELSVIKRRIAAEDILDVLPNFLSLEKFTLQITSISSRELISILQCLPQISIIFLHFDKFQGRPMGRLKTIQLNLRRLSIGVNRPAALYNTVANIVQHSPDLISLAVTATTAKKELTMKLGDGIQCLALTVKGKLPPISARGLKCLKLTVPWHHGYEPFEHCACDLSYLTHFELYGTSFEVPSDEVALSIMEAYNIGENLEFLRLESDPIHEILIRAPKLKELRMNTLFAVSPDVCPMLQTVRYGPDYRYLDKNEREKIKLDLKSRGITVLAVDDKSDVKDEMPVCYACGENHI